MEFPELGEHCDHPDCKQLEFLPLKCKCNKTFCPHHFNSHMESCETTMSNVVSDLKKIEETYECSADGCKARSIIPLLCSKCHKHYCLKHRHINDCAPPDPNLLAGGNKKVGTSIEQYNEAKASVDKELDRNLANAKRKPKNVETANKIQLMRIKNKATGSKSIPIADRIYFNVKSPTSIADKVVPVFISKSWSIGKSIDAIAQELKISNNNQQTNTLKLRLFRTDDGHILSTSMSDKMEDLLVKKIILNGQSLILEYVSSECVCLNI